jgi:hypothetical protein
MLYLLVQRFRSRVSSPIKILLNESLQPRIVSDERRRQVHWLTGRGRSEQRFGGARKRAPASGAAEAVPLPPLETPARPRGAFRWCPPFARRANRARAGAGRSNGGLSGRRAGGITEAGSVAATVLKLALIAVAGRQPGPAARCELWWSNRSGCTESSWRRGKRICSNEGQRSIDSGRITTVRAGADAGSAV